MTELRTIPIDQVKGLDKRVRTQMSPEALEELSGSMGALGQIVPVKVRPNGHGYVLVYGHRRVMAAKAAGLKTIDALIETLDDGMLLVQSLAENVMRDDLAPIDTAKALQHIKDESGWSDEKIAKFFGRGKSWAEHHLNLLEPEIAKAIGSSRAATFGAAHLSEVKAGLGNDRANMPAVIKKVVEEGLSTRQARQVAESAREAFSRFGKRGLATVLAQRYVPVAPDTIKPKGLKSAPPKTMSLLDQMAAAIKELSGILHMMGSPRNPAEKKKHAAYVRQAINMLETALKGARKLLAQLEEVQMSITEGITPRNVAYDVDEDGRVLNLRPVGSSVDLAYYHPDMQLADDAFVPAKEAADRLLDMMLHASDRLPSVPVSHLNAFEWERRALSDGIWTRLSGGPDGNPSYRLGLEPLTPIPCSGIPLDEPDAGGVNKWRGRSVSSVPTA